MTKRFTILSLLVLSLMIPMTVFSQGLKIGYASPEKIIDQLPEFKKIQTELQNLIQAKEASLVGKRDTLAKTLQDYQEIAATLSPQQNDAEQTKLQALNAELQELSNSIRLEVQRKQGELLQPLYAKVQEAINDVAKDMKLDFVFNRSTAQGDSIILFVLETDRNKLEITDLVIAKLTKK